MHVSLVRDVMKGVLTERPYPSGSRRSPGLVFLIKALTTLSASWAWIVAGSGYPLAVVWLIHLYERCSEFPPEKAMAGYPRPTEE